MYLSQFCEVRRTMMTAAFYSTARFWAVNQKRERQTDEHSERERQSQSRSFSFMYSFVNTTTHTLTHVCTASQGSMLGNRILGLQCLPVFGTKPQCALRMNRSSVSWPSLWVNTWVVRGSLYQWLSTICVSHGFLCPRLPIHRHWYLITKVIGIVEDNTMHTWFSCTNFTSLKSFVWIKLNMIMIIFSVSHLYSAILIYLYHNVCHHDISWHYNVVQTISHSHCKAIIQI